MKPNEIRRALDALPSAQARIDYLEALPERRNSHFVRFTLASLYLERDRPEAAEAVLREDIGEIRDPYDTYESYSLLAGLYMDHKREIPEEEMEEMIGSFDRMRKEAQGERERSGARQLKPERFRIYGKDPYQFERMMGDYHYGRNEIEKAHAFYERYYRDLDKPVETFVPDSMRRYADTLHRIGKTAEALYFVGCIIASKPYMLDDLFSFAEVHSSLNDGVGSLLILMFVFTLSEGYSVPHADKSRERIARIAPEVALLPSGRKAVELSEILLAGDRRSGMGDESPSPWAQRVAGMLELIEGLRKEGVRHFFLPYLEGLAYFARGDHAKALAMFGEFNETYPFLAESHYYALVCMHKMDPEGHGKSIVDSAERVIELKPGSSIAQMAKVYLGTLLGIPMSESGRLLTISEVGAILDSFLFHDAPLKVLDPLIASLTIRKNPYQAASVELMAKVGERREEYVSYLKNVSDLLNETGKKNIRQILAAMGETDR